MRISTALLVGALAGALASASAAPAPATSAPASTAQPATATSTPSAAPAPATSAPPAPPSAPALPAVTALLLDAKDLRRSTLVGLSGQIYEPAEAAASSAATARWVRRTTGGVSASVAGAARLDGELLVAGAQTPVFRRRDGQWLVAQLGQRGRVLFGAGPFFSIAIGRQIFIRVQGRLTRIATAPGPVVALWAAGEKELYLATDQVVLRRRGKALVPAAKLPGVLGFTGAAPHAVTAELAINLRTSARLRLPGQALRVVRSESAPAALVRLPAGALALARDLTVATSTVELPMTSEPTIAAVDAAGRALIVTAGVPPAAAPAAVPAVAPAAVPAVTPAAVPAVGVAPAVLVYDGTTWAPAALTDELPPPRRGPAAARSR